MANTIISTIDEYIAQFPAQRQELMQKIRQVIRESAPGAQERIRWAMPTYWQDENLVHFANGKLHIGLYPGADAMVEFAEALQGYKCGKGSIQFPVKDPIPYALIEQITRWRVAQVQKKG